MIKITGKVIYQNLGMGFWGISDNKGNNWRPINMPATLQQEGKNVEITAQKVKEGASIFMWGTPIQIISFR